jgi:excisionase family DNA binding protein
METTGRLLTAGEVAERLGYTERYVWRLGREGVLPRVKMPGRTYVRFAEEDVEQFVREGRQPAAPGRRGVSVAAPKQLPRRF